MKDGKEESAMSRQVSVKSQTAQDMELALEEPANVSADTRADTASLNIVLPFVRVMDHTSEDLVFVILDGKVKNVTSEKTNVTRKTAMAMDCALKEIAFANRGGKESPVSCLLQNVMSLTVTIEENACRVSVVANLDSRE